MSIYLPGFLIAVAVFRKPNAIPLCFSRYGGYRGKKTRSGPKLALLPGSLILIYQGLEEETLDQKLPGPPGWGLMQWASSSFIIKKQEMLKNQTPSLRNQMEIKNICHSKNK